MTHPALIERITRSLAFMLRHQPEKFDLVLDKEGFGELDDVVRALGERLGEQVESADVVAAIEGGDRPRYELRGTKIRALYGHSIPVEPGEPSQPPEFLYVGIDARDLQRAQQFGLRGGRRRFLHLALSAEDAREAGRRAAREYAILQVFAMDAWEEGVNFYDRKTLYLCEQIPTQYLDVLERGADGYEPRFEEHAGDRGNGPSRRREERSGRGDRQDRGGRDGGRRERPREERASSDDRPPQESRHEGRGEARHDDRGPRSERAPEDRRPRFDDRGPREERHHDDRGPREERHHDDRGPREERHHDERGPREERHRDERPAHWEDRGGRPERREERPERRDDRRGPPPRREEPRREAHRPTPAPANTAAAEEAGGFGLGIFEEERKSAPPPPPAPRPAPAAPVVRPKPVEDDFVSFGAGI
jgi:putative RNA 2'-phosphotransferase